MTKRARLWKVLLLVNVVVPLTGGVVLFCWPGFVPGTVGIPLDRSQYLLSYLIGAAEFAFALLCLLALRSQAADVRRLVSAVAITFHGAAGAATLLAWIEGTSGAVLINTAARVVMVVLFAALGLRSGRTS